MSFDIKKWQDAVREFRVAMDLPINEVPTALSEEEYKLHLKMIYDEFKQELMVALLKGDIVETFDAIIDVLYYLIGLATHAGMDLDAGFWEVHRSNMSKMDPVTKKAIKAGDNDPSGEPRGKVLKGPNYFKPNLRLILEEQGMVRVPTDAELEEIVEGEIIDD